MTLWKHGLLECRVYGSVFLGVWVEVSDGGPRCDGTSKSRTLSPLRTSASSWSHDRGGQDFSPEDSGSAEKKKGAGKPSQDLCSRQVLPSSGLQAQGILIST